MLQQTQMERGVTWFSRWMERFPDIASLAASSGYTHILTADSEESLDIALHETAGAASGPVLIEIRCACGSRKDLGRPTTTPAMNRDALMSFVR